MAVSAVATAATAGLVVTAVLAPPAGAAPPGSGTPPDATTSIGTAKDLDVMFIGAHPDDESGQLSTFGQWNADHQLSTGVITITRGEGGGNAVGPEEGPALGLIREAEERKAVGKAGITDIFNLDKVDFYYTVSEPLTAQVWNHDDTLGKIVRVIRQTRPEVLVTMNPAPSPGQHGNHQEAGRLAIDAYRLAGDPNAYPEQIRDEGLKPFAPSRIFRAGAAGKSATGPACARGFQPEDPSQDVYGVWSGTKAPDGQTWAAIERQAQREYASQGWSGFPDPPTDPNQLGCDYLTLIDSRTPIPRPGTDAAYTNQSPLAGALLAGKGDLPLGTGLDFDIPDYRVLPGQAFEATVTLTAPRRALPRATATLVVPDGWTVSGGGSLGTVTPGRAMTRTVRITPAANAPLGSNVRIGVQVSTANGMRGWNDESVRVTAPVTATQQLLPQVIQFQQWATESNVAQLSDIVRPVLTVPSGGSRTIDVTVTNHSSTSQSGTVTPRPPTGFSMTPASAPYSSLAPGATTTVKFTVTNTDAGMPTSNQGGENGDYLYTIDTTSSGATGTTRQAFELVPTTAIEQAQQAPTVDGVVSQGEYPGQELNVGRLWEGTACSSAADCSATARVAWRDDTLYIAVTVKDDVKGTALDAADCKRHWRTDAVEIAIDPRGTSENTSTTFKAAILPWTKEGPPCYLRDADNHQGPGPETAPGMKVASTVTAPYTGYTVETAIPMSLLPSAIDPQHMGLNILPYDSDTQDKTGQTRIGWSTWGGVQGDPYRWGIATLPGYTPPADRPTTPSDPVMPTAALSSLDSPQSIEQAVRNNVALAGDPASPNARAGWAVTSAMASGSTATVTVKAASAGTVHAFIRDASGTVGSVTTAVGAGTSTVTVPLTRAPSGAATALLGWDDGRGGTVSSQIPLRVS